MWLRRKHEEGVCGKAEVSAADQIISGLWINWRPYLGLKGSSAAPNIWVFHQTKVTCFSLSLWCLQNYFRPADAQHLPTCLNKNFMVSAATSWHAHVDVSSQAEQIISNTLCCSFIMTWYKNRALNNPQETSDKTCFGLIEGSWVQPVTCRLVMHRRLQSSNKAASVLVVW